MGEVVSNIIILLVLFLCAVFLVGSFSCSRSKAAEPRLDKLPTIEVILGQCTQLDMYSQRHPLFVCYQDNRTLLCDKKQCMNLSVDNACY